MYRRFLVILLRRTILVLLLVCLGCSAQSVSPEQTRRIEQQVRAYYNLPVRVNVTVGTLRPSEFPNYDALTIHLEGEDQKSDYDFLLSRDGKTLLRMTKLDLTADPYAEKMKKINVAGRPVRGNKDAKVVVVNFDDFQCPFCSRMHQVLFPEILKEYGDRVKFIYKDYPLTDIHPWAMHAAADANCLATLNSDAYWDFADQIHANQRDITQKGPNVALGAIDDLAAEKGKKYNVDPTKLQSCIKAQNNDAVKASVGEANALGVQATPTMFVNGQEVDGALPIEDVRALLDRALEREGVPVPAHPKSSSVGGSSSSSK
jgi:protein-disulfide isomerase